MSADLVLDVANSIENLGREWELLRRAVRAPVFYSYEYLRAFERSPLQDIREFVYVGVRSRESGDLLAICPAYVQTQSDPLGVVGPVLGDRITQDSVGLVTHAWYCYDTMLVAEPTRPAILFAICDSLADAAAANGAAWWGFVNVSSNSVVKLLTKFGLRSVQGDTRYRLSLNGVTDIEDHLATIRNPKDRNNLRRHSRRAQEAGAVLRIEEPPFGDLSDVIHLVRFTASKFGNQSLFPERRFEDFVRGIHTSVRLIRIDLKEQLLGVLVCFVDDLRLHVWLAGIRYDVDRSFSPFYVLMREAIELALRLGLETLEGGRRNDRLKLRFGLRPCPLFVCVTTT